MWYAAQDDVLLNPLLKWQNTLLTHEKKSMRMIIPSLRQELMSLAYY